MGRARRTCPCRPGREDELAVEALASNPRNDESEGRAGGNQLAAAEAAGELFGHDVPSALLQQSASGTHREEAEVRDVQDTMSSVVEVATEHEVAECVEVAEVGERDDQPAIGSDEVGRRHQRVPRVDEMFENIVEHDTVDVVWHVGETIGEGSVSDVEPCCTGSVCCAFLGFDASERQLGACLAEILEESA